MKISNIILNFIGKKNLVKYLGIEQWYYEKQEEQNRRTQVSIGFDSKLYSRSQIYNLGGKNNLIQILDNSHIRGELLVFKYGGRIEIGSNCFVGEGSRIWSGDRVFIGNGVLISHNVNIIDTNSHELDAEERVKRFQSLISIGHWGDKGSIISSPIIINDDCWISFGSTILKGVTLGKGAIIAANAVVTSDVPEYTIVAGNPARVIKELPQPTK